MITEEKRLEVYGEDYCRRRADVRLQAEMLAQELKKMVGDDRVRVVELLKNTWQVQIDYPFGEDR